MPQLFFIYIAIRTGHPWTVHVFRIEFMKFQKVHHLQAGLRFRCRAVEGAPHSFGEVVTATPGGIFVFVVQLPPPNKKNNT